MRFSSDDLVCRIACNLEQVHTADEAMRAWLPLVSELRPVSAAFEAAHEDGAGGALKAKDEQDGSPYGAYLVLALTGADPLNPDGEEKDYADTGEDLP
ncbi:hypothetical protein ACIBAB_27155 [Streptomyces rubiginosohelvolus]|uniref:hypothetical protein n=1 Tax=Streptomyces rubiginosohelvolus TaxID=67362 RepID=UPI0037A0E251